MPVALAVLLLVSLVAACAQGGNRRVTAVHAVAATEAARTFRMVGDSRSWNPSKPRTTLSSSQSQGEIDVAGHRVHLTARTTSADRSDPNDTFELIEIGTDAWAKFSEPTFNQLGSDVTILGQSSKPWQHTTRKRVRSFYGADPSTMFEQLRAHGATLAERGKEKVRGVSTTRYEVKDGGTTSTSTKGFSVRAVSIEVWTDRSDLVRRIKEVLDVESSEDDSAQRSEITEEFYDFGASLQIEPPLASLVEEAPVASDERLTTTTSAPTGPRRLGNELVTFEPVVATSAPPCTPPALPTKDKKECLTVGSVQWDRPVLVSAEASSLTSGRWVVALVLTEKAIARFNEIAHECYSRGPSCATGRIAVVVDDTVHSAPPVQSDSFKRDQIQISGNLTEREAKDLAASLT